MDHRDARVAARQAFLRVAGHDRALDARPLARGPPRAGAMPSSRGIEKSVSTNSGSSGAVARASASACSPSSATVDLEAEVAQLLGQDQAHALVVVDHQHRADADVRGVLGVPGRLARPADAWSRAGSSRRRCRARLRSSIRNTPPDCWTKPATIDRPRPVPLPAALVVKNGSVTRSISSGGMPPPSSSTRMRRIIARLAGASSGLARRRRSRPRSCRPRASRRAR